MASPAEFPFGIHRIANCGYGLSLNQGFTNTGFVELNPKILSVTTAGHSSGIGYGIDK